MDKSIPDIGTLLNNRTLSNVIKEAYNKLTPSSDIDNFDLDIIVEGAKMYALDYECIKGEIEHYKAEHSYWLNKDINMPLSDSGFDSYRDGFREGYFNFEKGLLVSETDPNSTTNVGIIFNFVNNKTFKHAISLTDSGDYDNFSEVRMYNNGKDRGMMYRAWVLILSNPENYESIFEELEVEDNSTLSNLETSELMNYDLMSKLEQKNYELIYDDIQSVKDCFTYVEEYRTLFLILIKYAVSKEYIKPTSIRINNGTKTKVIMVFNYIHKKVGKVEQLSNDEEFLNVVRIIQPFTKYSNMRLCKAIQR